MSGASFVGVGGRGKKQLLDQGDLVTFFIKDALSLPTLLLLGASIQLALLATLPVRVAVAPVALLALYTLTSTAVDSGRGASNSFMRKVILGRTSAQLATPESGEFGAEPAKHPVVVFHFGVRFNHPLGLLSPGAKATIDHFIACNDQVLARSEEYGMLGLSAWRAAERTSENTLMMVYYFRDVEGLNRFAHDEIHRKAWDWIVKAGHRHIGFFHEAFCVPPKAYESIYVNFPPLLMGATSVKCTKTETGDEEWVRSLVSADVGPLRSQFGRMGRGFKEALQDRM